MALRKCPVVFFRTEAGADVIVDWIRSFDDADRFTIGQTLMRVQYRWPVGMPLCRSLDRGLWEVRVSLPSNRIARLIFVPRDGELLVLHGFIKKTQRTPQADLDLAEKRARTFRNGTG